MLRNLQLFPKWPLSWCFWYFSPSEPSFPNSCVSTDLQMPIQPLIEAATSEAHKLYILKAVFFSWAELMKPDFPQVCTQSLWWHCDQAPPRSTHAFQDGFPQDFCSPTCHLGLEPPHLSSQYDQNYMPFCHVPLSSQPLPNTGDQRL